MAAYHPAPDEDDAFSQKSRTSVQVPRQDAIGIHAFSDAPLQATPRSIPTDEEGKHLRPRGSLLQIKWNLKKSADRTIRCLQEHHR